MHVAEDRQVYFDGLRGIAALNVALSHFVVAFAFAIYTGSPEHSHGVGEIELSAYPFMFIGAGANFAVCIFLALSGFVLAKAFHFSKLSIWGLVLKRSLRLGLPVLAAGLLGWIFLKSGLIFNADIAAATRSDWLAGQFTQRNPAFTDGLRQAYNSLIGSVTHQNTYNSALWTMPIEFMGSLVLIIFFGTGISRKNRVVAGLLLVLMGALFARTYVAIMFFGASAYLLQAERLSQHLRWKFAYLIVICAIGTVPFSGARGYVWDAIVGVVDLVPAIEWRLPGFINQGNVSLWHAVAAVTLVVLLSGWKQAQAMLSSPVFTWLGQISFPLYLTHVPALFSAGCFGMMSALEAGATYGAAVAIAFLAYLPTAIALALLMERWVDRNAIKIADEISKTMTRSQIKPNGGSVPVIS